MKNGNTTHARILKSVATQLGWTVAATEVVAHEMGGIKSFAAFVAEWTEKCQVAWSEKRGLRKRVETSTKTRDRVITRIYWRNVPKAA